MPNYIVVDNNGIGFKIFVPNPFYYKENVNYKVYIYEHIREDEHSLYGFKEDYLSSSFTRFCTAE